MKVKNIALVMSLLILPPVVFADDIQPVAADSDGLSQFDKNLTQGKSRDVRQDDEHSGRPTHPDNFGSKVSAEAKRLKASDEKRSGQFGKWVSSQRRQDAEHRNGKSVDNSGRGNAGDRGSSDSMSHSVPRPDGAGKPTSGSSGHGGHH